MFIDGCGSAEHPREQDAPHLLRRRSPSWRMMEMQKDGTRPRVTIFFNCCLFAYYLVSITVDFLFDPDTPDTAPIDHLFSEYPEITTILMIGVVVLAVWVGTILFKEFWNRLVVDLARLRTIELREAFAIVTAIALITS